jgi:hypothetical protein
MAARRLCRPALADRASTFDRYFHQVLTMNVS